MSHQKNSTRELIKQNVSDLSEKQFSMDLPTLISGIDPDGNTFEEQNMLLNISSKQASFWLKQKVMIGDILNLKLSIPKTLILEKFLTLMISGEVVFASLDSRHNGQQMVSIQLHKMFKIRSVTGHPRNTRIA